MGDAATGAPPRYTQDQLMRLVNDADFQARFGADPELNRLMNPVPEEDLRNEEDLQSYGMTRRIMGVDVPPAHLGHLRLLTIIGNECVKIKPDWSRGFDYQMEQLTEALFVLRYGAAGVGSFAAVFRWARAVAKWSDEALKNPALAPVVLEAERKLAEARAPFDAAVMRFGVKYLRIEPDCDFVAEGNALLEHLGHALDGFGLLPQVKRPEEDGVAQKKTVSCGMKNWRHRLSRALVRCAQRLLRGKSGGGYR